LPDTLICAHGGNGLVNRFVAESDRTKMLKSAITDKTLVIANSELSFFYRIADGIFSPLKGPMSEEDFYSVLDYEYIERNGKKYAWTIPISFSITEKESAFFKKGDRVTIKQENGRLIGSLEISDIFYFDKDRYNLSVYGTNRKDHPGPRIIYDHARNYLLGGQITAFPEMKNFDFGKYILSPEETREIFKKRKWLRVVAFQTRNPLHRAHEYAMVYAMEKLTQEGYFTGVVLNPLVGETKSDDVPASVRIKTYEALIEQKLIGYGDRNEKFWKDKGYDFMEQVLLIALDVKMFYAGPKEAVMHAIYRQNLGFTDIIIGRKHADVSFDDGSIAWDDFAAQDKFDNLRGELLIKPFKIGTACYFEELGKVDFLEKHKETACRQVSLSGKELRKKLENGEVIDERIMRKPVAEILANAYRHNLSALRTEIKSKNITWHDSGISGKERQERAGHKAACIWLTGLPSSGKSTIATGLQSSLFERKCNVFILDGDNLRHGLNKDLGFSRLDREENIRRIAEVAKLFVEAGFICITAFVSPYKLDRDKARSIFTQQEFIEVFVKAGISVCETRDAKGLYGKARRGEIKEFTGVSAPYEEPLNPELVVDTESQSQEENRDLILGYLQKKEYIS